jgi:hypothetical protein
MVAAAVNPTAIATFLFRCIGFFTLLGDRKYLPASSADPADAGCETPRTRGQIEVDDG